MQFNSLSFIFLLPIFIVIYYVVKKYSGIKYSKIVVIVFSMIFYGYSNDDFLIYLFVTIAINYLLYLLQLRFKNKLLLLIGIFINVLSLVIFRFSDKLFSMISFFSNNSFINKILVPLGVSFITFKQISFLVDTFKLNIKVSLIDYILYISLFTQITSGPIMLFDDYVNSETCKTKTNDTRIDWEYIAGGVCLFSLGLVKKVLFADTLSVISTTCIDDISKTNSLYIILGILSYSLQIYFDFSGYSDMANGINKMIKFPTVKNFNSPYLAISINDFWKRWHISLTKFFTKYIYIPLGGNRKGILRKYINIMIVFIVSGIWHGTGMNFIIWGVLFGLLKIIEDVLHIKDNSNNRIISIFRRVFTFAIVCFMWLIFRTESFYQLKEIIDKLLINDFTWSSSMLSGVFDLKVIDYYLSNENLVNIIHSIVPYLFIVISLLLTQVMPNSDIIENNELYAKPVISVVLAILVFACIIRFSQVSSFIYWRF